MINQSWINDVDESLKQALVTRHPSSIRYIINPSYEIFRIVIDKDVDCIDRDTDMCEKSQLYLIQKYPDFYYLIANPTDDVTSLALTLRPANIQHVKVPTQEQLIEAFTVNPMLIDLFEGERLALIDDYVKSYVRIVQ